MESETGFSPSTSVFLCEYHSTNTPYSSLSTCCSYQKNRLGEYWEPSNKQCSFINPGAMDMTVVSLFFFKLKRDPFPSQGDYDCNGQIHNVIKSGHWPQAV